MAGISVCGSFCRFRLPPSSFLGPDALSQLDGGHSHCTGLDILIRSTLKPSFSPSASAQPNNIGSAMIRMLLIVLLALLLNLELGFAAVGPALYFPDSLKNDVNPRKYPTTRGKFNEGFRDAVTLARVVVLTGSDCDPVIAR